MWTKTGGLMPYGMNEFNGVGDGILRDDIEPVSVFEVVESEDDDTQSQHKEELSKFECKAADNTLGHLQTAISTSLFEWRT
uniref:Uncharacterized protein n=1 Tax=Tanacetum cinerariifolium TaxID=118510 RepID=A0A699J7Z5_TANCI|nr:hypothetical protein [Tanacetum cinerariifolium]